MPRSFEMPRLLLVEHDGLLSEITSFRLELLGYHVLIAASVPQAQAAIAKQLPSLILLDVELPGVDAVEYVMRLRGDILTAEVPVLIMSVSSDPEQVRRAFVAGANDYVVAPYDPAVLEQKIESLLAADSVVT